MGIQGGGAGFALSGLGALTSAYGAFTEAKVARSEARTNAMLAERNALDAMLRGQQEFDRSNEQYAQVKGRQAASLAANGVALDEGSPLDILTGTDQAREVDAAIIRNNAEREAYGHRVEASVYRRRVKSIKPGLSLATSLLGSASAVSDRWGQWQRATGKAG